MASSSRICLGDRRLPSLTPCSSPASLGLLMTSLWAEGAGMRKAHATPPARALLLGLSLWQAQSSTACLHRTPSLLPHLMWWVLHLLSLIQAPNPGTVVPPLLSPPSASAPKYRPETDEPRATARGTPLPSHRPLSPGSLQDPPPCLPASALTSNNPSSTQQAVPPLRSDLPTLRAPRSHTDRIQLLTLCLLLTHPPPHSSPAGLGHPLALCPLPPAPPAGSAAPRGGPVQAGRAVPAPP